MTTNYLQMMIDSLNKKKDILTRIIALNEEQDKILSKPELDDNAFDANMKAKGDCIDGQLMLIKKCMLMRYRL